MLLFRLLLELEGVQLFITRESNRAGPTLESHVGLASTRASLPVLVMILNAVINVGGKDN